MPKKLGVPTTLLTVAADGHEQYPFHVAVVIFLLYLLPRPFYSVAALFLFPPSSFLMDIGSDTQGERREEESSSQKICGVPPSFPSFGALRDECLIS